MSENKTPSFKSAAKATTALKTIAAIIALNAASFSIIPSAQALDFKVGTNLGTAKEKIYEPDGSPEGTPSKNNAYKPKSDVFEQYGKNGGKKLETKETRAERQARQYAQKYRTTIADRRGYVRYDGTFETTDTPNGFSETREEYETFNPKTGKYEKGTTKTFGIGDKDIFHFTVSNSGEDEDEQLRYMRGYGKNDRHRIVEGIGIINYTTNEFIPYKSLPKYDEDGKLNKYRPVEKFLNHRHPIGHGPHND